MKAGTWLGETEASPVQWEPRQWYGDERQAREVGRPQMTKGLISHARELGCHPMGKRSLWEGFQEGCGVSCSSFRTLPWLCAKMECCRSRADEENVVAVIFTEQEMW